jgi:hypothetical protein
MFGSVRSLHYIYTMMKQENKLMKIELTVQEIWGASKHMVVKNKKKYNRKPKHKNRFGSPE